MEKKNNPIRKSPRRRTQEQECRRKAAGERKTEKQKKTRKGKKDDKRRQINVSIPAVAGILAAVCIIVAIPYIKDSSSPETGAEVPHGAYCYGIDISKYQHKIRWDSLMVLTDGRGRTIYSKTKAKDIRPVSFVFIKATEGSSMRDKKFRTHWEDAAGHGIRRGAYHFFRSSKDPVKQAENFISTVGELSPADLPPVLDIETIHAGCPAKLLNENALIWLETVKNHYGRKPIVYSSASFINDILCDEITGEYPVWVAHYGTSSPGCGKWHIWQFTDRSLVYGAEGYVDLNVCTHAVLKSL